MTTLPPEELRTLLENAAKACGIRHIEYTNDYDGQYGLVRCDEIGRHLDDWQPHLPGLDSQVLAAELNIYPQWHPGGVWCGIRDSSEDAIEAYADHPSKAHAQAMAVLRVAAATGSASHEHVDAEGGWDGANVVDNLSQDLILHWMPLPAAPKTEDMPWKK